MKTLLLAVSILLVTGCENRGGYESIDGWKAACIKAGGDPFWLRSNGWVCFRQDIFVKVPKP